MLDLAVDYIKELQKQFKVLNKLVKSRRLHLGRTTTIFNLICVFFCRVLAMFEPTASV